MKKRFSAALIFIGYSVVLIRVMVFKVVPIITFGQVTLNFGGTNAGNQANFLPFATILPYLLGNNGLTIALLNLGGNIVLLVPIGFLASLLHRNMTWKKAFALGAVGGLFVEIMQSVLRVGIFDIDDVILNTLGVMIGYLVFIVLAKWIRERKYIHIVLGAQFVLASAAGSFYIIYPHGPLPEVNIGSDTGDVQSDVVSNKQEGTIPQHGDLCGGTGGAGQIVSMGNSTIAIKGRNDVAQTIHLTNRTIIRTLEGSVSESDLNVGDHVTVVIDDSETAETVLVCSGK